MKAIAIKLGIIIVVAYLFILAAMAYYQRSLIYFPQPAIPQAAAEKILPQARIIHVSTEDGVVLQAYFVPPKDSAKPIILAFHGNGSLGLYLSENFSAPLKDGYGLLLAEYRGYSGNEGKPTEEGLYRDADAYLTYLSTNYPDNRMIAYGQSLGSAVAVDLVARNPHVFRAMILEVPFESAIKVADRIYPYILFKKWILRDQYLSNEKIGKITIPKLFLLAGQDEVVGFDSGINLFDAAPDPKQIRVYNDATHMSVFDYGASNDMMDFLGSL